MYDAKTVTPAKISVNLTPITTDNRNLATEGHDQGIFMNYTGWFNNRKNYIYDNFRNYPTSSPYPWTRLGYTYDWGSATRIGLSEFIAHGRKVNGAGISVRIRRDLPLLL